MWSTPELIRGEILTTMRYTNRRLPLPLPTFTTTTTITPTTLSLLYYCIYRVENVEVNEVWVDGLKAQVVVETVAIKSVLSDNVRLKHSS